MIQAGDLVLVDTNILLSATDTGRERHQDCMVLLQGSRPAGWHLLASPQIAREYLAVATRPSDHNGLGLSTGEALENLIALGGTLVFLDEPATNIDILARLLGEYEVSGKQVHDANMVATMMANGVDWLVTDNPGDFSRFDSIHIRRSSDVAAALGN